MNQSSSRARSSAEGDYFFYVEGLPGYFTWGMLKDAARKAPACPGWTEMASNPHGMQKGRGWVKIRRSRDAYNLYSYFANGPQYQKSLKVYLWSTARSPPELLKCNCDVPRQSQAFSQQQTVTFYNGSPLQAPSGFEIPISVPRRTTPPQPTYVYTNNGRPVNATAGVVRTESRGIFLSKLDTSISQKQLEEHLNQVGTLESCDVWKDSATGRSRGIATAKYTTTEAATMAVRMFNGQKMMGRNVKVRLDTETETVKPSISNSRGEGLVIANGSL